MKICSKCGNEKSNSDFYRNTATKDGLSGYCKSCLDASNKIYKKTEKGKEGARLRTKRHVEKNRARHLANEEPNVLLGESQMLVKIPDDVLDSLKGKYLYVDSRVVDALESYLDKVHDMSLDVGELDEVIHTYLSHMMHLADMELPELSG